MSSFQAALAKPLFDAQQCFCLFIAPPRAALHAAIERRFDAMLAGGALDEVGALNQRKLDSALPIMRAHGVQYQSSRI